MVTGSGNLIPVLRSMPIKMYSFHRKHCFAGLQRTSKSLWQLGAISKWHSSHEFYGHAALRPFCFVNSFAHAVIEASAGYVKPKLKVSYLSPECPQTIVDLVSPPLRELNWACSVEPQSATPPIFIWEGSRRSIDPAPTLSRGGLVNRVSGAFSITTKVGMLKAV